MIKIRLIFSYRKVYNQIQLGGIILKRKGIKIPVIILTALTYISVFFSREFLVNLALDINIAIDNAEGAVAILLFFFVISIVAFFVIACILVMTTINIVLCSIDIYKSIKNEEKFVFDIVFLSLNYVIHLFMSMIIVMLFM